MANELDLDSLIPLTPEQRIGHAIAKLTTLTADQVTLDDSCPICLVPFSNIISGAAQNDGILTGVAPKPVKLCGVTKLEGCGHVFCRVDLIEWIRGRHGTCPTCRHSFLDIKPLTESDFESDDDDYIPEDEDEEEDDAFMDTEDDWDFDADGDMDTDVRGDLDIADEEEVDADLWEDHDDDMDNMGLSDGYGSESYSEGDLTVSVEGESYSIDGARVFTNEGENAVQGASTGASPRTVAPKP